jgi:hypothetical protein
MNINPKQLKMLIGKMMNVIKPNGVSNMNFHLTPINKNEYYLGVTYIVPDGSEFLGDFKKTDYYRSGWNREIKNTIKNYFDIDVIINSSGVQSESYFNR